MKKMHAAAAVTRISRSVHAPPTTVAAAAGSLATQDYSSEDVNIVVAEFIQPYSNLVLGGGEEVDPVSSESQLRFPSDLVNDIQAFVIDLINDKSVVNHVRRRRSFQELEQRLLRSAPAHEISRDVLSLAGSGIPEAILNDLSDNNEPTYVENHYSDPNASEEAAGKYSGILLRERLSSTNLEALFQKLEESGSEPYDCGIRLTCTRNQTPGLLSLINCSVQTDMFGRARRSSPAAGANILTSARIKRRVSQGHVGSPPRERVGTEAAASNAVSAFNVPAVAAGQVTDAVPQILILLATTILLATSLRKQGANQIVDKLIQFTRKVTSWIVAHWYSRV